MTAGRVTAGRDKDAETSSATGVFRLRQEQLRQALSTLPEREQEVLRTRFGLDVYSLTLDEVRIGVSRERIRQIEAKALRRRRHRLVHLIRDLRDRLAERSVLRLKDYLDE